MAKVSFKNLGLKTNQEVKIIKFNEQEIEVKQYLPINDKLDLISNTLNKASETDENNFANPVKIKVYFALELVYAYTNLNITEKQKEDAWKLYDVVLSSGLLVEILYAIPADEYSGLCEGLWKTADAIYAFRHSALGILESIGKDYDNLNFDVNEIQSKLADPNNMELLKDILTKLG